MFADLSIGFRDPFISGSTGYILPKQTRPTSRDDVLLDSLIQFWLGVMAAAGTTDEWNALWQ